MLALDALRRDLALAHRFAGALPLLWKTRPGRTHTITDVIEEHARRRPGHPALIHEERMLDYRALDSAANRVARWAIGRGLRHGDTVALLMENRPEFVVLWLGLARLGIVTALVNTNLRGQPLAHTLSISGARHLVLDAALEDAWRSAEPRLETRLEVWSSGGPIAGAEEIDADLATRSTGPIDAHRRKRVTGRDRLFYIYTSGTTGLPKAANFSHQRFLGAAIGGSVLAGLRESDRVYVALPLYHTAGGAMALGGALLKGATAVIAPRFSASRFWSDCVRHRVTVFQYIGELCRYLLLSPPHPDEHRHQIRYAIGNGLRPDVWRGFQERFAIPRIYEFYGATEGNVTFLNLDGRIGSVGRMPGWMRHAAGVHLVRFDIERQEVARGPDGFCIDCDVDEPGEAIGRITQSTRFEGYSDEAANEKKILRDVFEQGDAYFRTGDLLRRDAEDYFYFVDRIGDTFRWKGENVSTGEVAEVLSAAPGVREPNVYGVEVPGAEGRAGMATLVVDEGFEVEAFHAFVSLELPAYARPVFLRLRPEIEITGTFKHRKVDAVREGFDPHRIPDPLYVLDASADGYVPLDAARHAEIVAGRMRF